MGELLPEFWSSLREEDADADAKRESKGQSGRKVTDVYTWLQCYSSYISVQATAAPSTIPELMAYMAALAKTTRAWHGSATTQHLDGKRH